LFVVLLLIRTCRLEDDSWNDDGGAIEKVPRSVF
jgi:hypothetical protein